MNRREFFSKSAKSLTVAGVASLAGCGGTSKPESVSIQINGFGTWSGSIGGASGSRSVQGRGRESYRFQEIPDIVSATIQKSERGQGELSVSINADGEVVQASSTTAEFGVVSVSHSFI